MKKSEILKEMTAILKNYKGTPDQIERLYILAHMEIERQKREKEKSELTVS